MDERDVRAVISIIQLPCKVMSLIALAVMLATLVSFIIHYYMHVNFLECNFVETAYNMALKLTYFSR